jgi:hypothetical protein
MNDAAPKRAQLIAAVSRVVGNGDPAVVAREAANIYWHMNILRLPARGSDIGRDVDGFYARPRAATVGPARELRDLAGKARKAVKGNLDKEDWIAAWAALPTRTQTLLWTPRLIQTPKGRTLDSRDISGSYSAPGFQTIAPKPEVVLPSIEDELNRFSTAEKSAVALRRRAKRRKRNEYEHAVIEAIRHAYQALTGHKGARATINGKLTGKLFRLGREIDDIFDTKLFAEKDSRRLRFR